MSFNVRYILHKKHYVHGILQCWNYTVALEEPYFSGQEPTQYVTNSCWFQHRFVVHSVVLSGKQQGVSPQV